MVKTFSVGAEGRKNMSKGEQEYWVEVHDGEKSRPTKYDITARDRAQDSKNGKKAKGVTWSVKKRKQ